MNGGPFRAPQSNEGGMVNNRQASVPTRHAEEPRPVATESPKTAPQRPVAAPSTSTRTKSPKKTISIVGGIIVILVAALTFYLLQNRGSITGSIDSGKYQAVFFTNGQVYFGKLQQAGSDYLKLTDVFYLQAKDSVEDEKLQNTASSSANDVQLIKLGSEIHGPQDQMVINKSQVLFFENLKADGKVSSSIDQYNKTNKK